MKIRCSLSLLIFLVCSFNSGAVDEYQGTDTQAPGRYSLKFGSFSKEYDVVAPQGNPYVKIVYVPDFSDNMEMAEQAAKSLRQLLFQHDLLTAIQAIVVPGDKANCPGTILLQKVAKFRKDFNLGETHFAILRSAEKGMPVDSVTYTSITGGEKTLKIRQDQADKLRGRNILLFDDVISTGGTMKAARELLERQGCNVIAFACVATEGDELKELEGKLVLSLAHLPVWNCKNK